MGRTKTAFEVSGWDDDAVEEEVGGYFGDDDDDDVDDDTPIAMSVTSGDDLDALFARTSKMGPIQALNQMGRAKVNPQRLYKAGVNLKVARAVAHLSRISKAVSHQAGVIDADYLRRPNLLIGVYGTVMAPGATLAFQITPSGGTSWYRLLAFLAGDDQAQIFGFTSLKVGGLDQIYATQVLPIAPIPNAVGWMGFVARGDGQKFNLQPWTGQVFDNSVQVTGTIANMSVAASGDAISLAPRFLIPSQTDPCNQSSPHILSAAKWNNGILRRALRIHTTLR